MTRQEYAEFRYIRSYEKNLTSAPERPGPSERMQAQTTSTGSTSSTPAGDSTRQACGWIHTSTMIGSGSSTSVAFPSTCMENRIPGRNCTPTRSAQGLPRRWIEARATQTLECHSAPGMPPSGKAPPGWFFSCQPSCEIYPFLRHRTAILW